MERGFREIEAKLGPVDLLVNNAGVGGPFANLWEADPDSWWQTFEVNVRGAFLCSRAVLPEMVRRGEVEIINLASNAGVFRWPTASSYSASKAALIKLTENLAFELKRHRVSVFAFHPGLADGGMHTRRWRRMLRPARPRIARRCGFASSMKRGTQYRRSWQPNPSSSSHQAPPTR